MGRRSRVARWLTSWSSPEARAACGSAGRGQADSRPRNRRPARAGALPEARHALDLEAAEAVIRLPDGRVRPPRSALPEYQPHRRARAPADAGHGRAPVADATAAASVAPPRRQDVGVAGSGPGAFVQAAVGSTRRGMSASRIWAITRPMSLNRERSRISRVQELTASEHGFTLIELLIVVAIIANLLAIAVPSYLGSRTVPVKGQRRPMSAPRFRAPRSSATTMAPTPEWTSRSVVSTPRESLRRGSRRHDRESRNGRRHVLPRQDRQHQGLCHARGGRACEGRSPRTSQPNAQARVIEP